jgi:hypothetical protein
MVPSCPGTAEFAQPTSALCLGFIEASGLRHVSHLRAQWLAEIGWAPGARQAAPRPDRPLADSGRRGEIDALSTRVRAKMS